MPTSTPLRRILQRLEKHYGKQRPPVTDPLHLIIWENVAYLANDERRAEAFALLKKSVGLKPERILAAPHEKLVAVGRFGIVPFISAKKLVRIAEVAHHIFHGDLRSILKLPLAQAKKELKRFPSLGDAGTERILLLTGAQPVLALDSNGLRALERLGYGEKKKSYAATYKAVQQAAAAELPADATVLTSAHLLLRLHGKEVCKTNNPLCTICPVNKLCRYAQQQSARAARA